MEAIQMSETEREFLDHAIDEAILGRPIKKRGPKPLPLEFKRYRAYVSLFYDLEQERARINENIRNYGIDMFGKYAKSNKAMLANAAAVIIGYGC